MIYHKFQKSSKYVFGAGILCLLIFAALTLDHSIPDTVYIAAGDEENINFHVPVTGTVDEEDKEAFLSLTGNEVSEVFDNQSQPVDNKSIHLTSKDHFTTLENGVGTFHINCKLLGIFPIKQVTVNVVDNSEVIPAGMPIGIYTKTSGVLIIGTGTIGGADGLNYEPAYQIVKSGDYIMTFNQEPVADKEDLISKVNQYGNAPIVLGVKRSNEDIEIKVDAVPVAEGGYKLGIWVRDDMAGVGTMTYLTKNLNYGALGHPISDADTGTMISMGEGKVYTTDIVGIVKGSQGSPGELTGVINYNSEYCLGDIQKNTQVGIYGNLLKLPDELADQTSMKVGFKQDIDIGSAFILSELNGERKYYDIEIDRVDYNSTEINKGILFHVTDPELLDITGGIVQGMSGSPIIQNDKVIGAVTHVFISDATKGYGIFVENMLAHE